MKHSVPSVHSVQIRPSPPARRRGLKRTLHLPLRHSRLSPPARRRGLKPSYRRLYSVPPKSPPARRRGLKQQNRCLLRCRPASPPARRRGLKPAERWLRLLGYRVASRAEAWIETAIVDYPNPRPSVASRAEAWIETQVFCIGRLEPGSPPARRRGLKRLQHGRLRPL